MESEISEIESEIINEILSMKQIQPRLNFDPKKLRYNDYYRSHEFWASKFPKGYDKIPHMNLIISDICNKNDKSPLDEMKLRSEQNEIFISER
jgi:hypothetical protein